MQAKALQLLAALGKQQGSGQVNGLRTVTVATVDPVTIVFEGTPLAIDADVFEIPAEFQPLRVGDQLQAFPMVSQGAASRWGLVAKMTGGVLTGIMQSANTLTVDGLTKVWASGELILPPYVFVPPGTSRTLQAGDKVMLLPSMQSGALKLAVMNIYT